MTAAQTLLLAARLLENDAFVLKECHTTDGNWDLTDPCDKIAKSDYDDRMTVAAKLRLLATVSA